MMLMKVVMKVSFIRWWSQQHSFGQKGKNTFLLIRDDMYVYVNWILMLFMLKSK